jgi:hypothetical protein
MTFEAHYSNLHDVFQAMATDNYFGNSKYTLMCMDLSSGPKSSELPKSRRAELCKVVTGAKSYDDLCEGFGVDVERARVQTVEEIFAEGSSGVSSDDVDDDGGRAQAFIDKVEAAAAAAAADPSQPISSSFPVPSHKPQAVAI